MQLICPTGEFIWGWRDDRDYGKNFYDRISRFVGAKYRANYQGKIDVEPIWYNKTRALKVMLAAQEREDRAKIPNRIKYTTLSPFPLPTVYFKAYRDDDENETIYLFVQINRLVEVGSVPPKISKLLFPFIENGGAVSFKFKVDSSENKEFTWGLILGTSMLQEAFDTEKFLNELSKNGVTEICKKELWSTNLEKGYDELRD